MAFVPTFRKLAAFTPTAPRMIRKRVHVPKIAPEVLSDPERVAKAFARTASTPHKLAQRQAIKNKRPLQPGEVDLEQFRATEPKRYRIRGIVKGSIVGQRVYLPNYIVSMVRNKTPKGFPYNPFEATFHISQSMSKLDVRGYLKAVYGLDVTYIRTDIYTGFNESRRNRNTMRKGVRERARFKRAVVGLNEPFYYPLAVEDMAEADREALLKKYQETWGMGMEGRMRGRMSAIIRHSLPADSEPEPRRRILERIRERRAEREQKTQAALKGIQRLRIRKEREQTSQKQ